MKTIKKNQRALLEDNRAEPRKSIMTVVQVLWEAEPGSPRVTSGKIEDTSPKGVSVRIKDPIAVGSRVILQWHQGQLAGTVKYCILFHNEYILGLQRDSDTNER